jgi:hypothetical protein
VTQPGNDGKHDVGKGGKHPGQMQQMLLERLQAVPAHATEPGVGPPSPAGDD